MGGLTQRSRGRTDTAADLPPIDVRVPEYFLTTARKMNFRNHQHARQKRNTNGSNNINMSLASTLSMYEASNTDPFVLFVFLNF